MKTETQARHTPGPWNATDDQRGEFVIDGTPQYICGVSYWAETRPIEKGWLTQEEARANARLIAAAPELLEALKQEHAVLIQTDPDEHHAAGPCPICDLIAKAERR